MFGNQDPQELKDSLDELRKKTELFDEMMDKLNGRDSDDILQELEDLRNQ